MGVVVGGSLGRWREAKPKSLGVFQSAALGTGLRSVLGGDAVSGRQGLGDSPSSRLWHLHLQVVPGAGLN